MTNDTSFNSKSNPPSSIMEPIDETPSLISTVSKTSEKNQQIRIDSNRLYDGRFKLLPIN